MEDKVGLQIKESYALWNGINHLYAQWAKKFGLTYDSLFVLHALYYSRTAKSQKEICVEWTMPKQTVSSILNSFEKRGYVLRLEAEDDKRHRGIVLTADGRKFASGILEKLDNMERMAIKRMGADSMHSLLSGNALFYHCLREEIEPVTKQEKEKRHDL